MIPRTDVVPMTECSCGQTDLYSTDTGSQDPLRTDRTLRTDRALRTDMGPKDDKGPKNNQRPQEQTGELWTERGPKDK